MRLSIRDFIDHDMGRDTFKMSAFKRPTYSPEQSILGITRDELDSLKGMKGVAKTWGPEGLLGHYLSSKFLNNPRFNIDFPESQINWAPSDKWNFYARPDLLDDDTPRGLQIGGSFNF